jgi:2-methylcitrate dehydratase PrpD
MPEVDSIGVVKHLAARTVEIRDGVLGPADLDDARSRLLGRSVGADPTIAALLNVIAAHTLELDDIYAPGMFRPGAPVVSAALAVADHVNASGLQLLHAIMAGYEVGCRVATDLGPEH